MATCLRIRDEDGEEVTRCLSLLLLVLLRPCCRLDWSGGQRGGGNRGIIGLVVGDGVSVGEGRGGGVSDE